MNQVEAEKDETDYEFAAYVKGTKEERLKIISDAHKASNDERQKGFFEGMMFVDSIGLEEHPEWFQFGCCCDTCLSYGD